MIEYNHRKEVHTMEPKEMYKQFGMNEYGLYKSRYYAQKYRLYDEVTVKVDGGYKNMKWSDYQIWKNQK